MVPIWFALYMYTFQPDTRYALFNALQSPRVPNFGFSDDPQKADSTSEDWSPERSLLTTLSPIDLHSWQEDSHLRSTSVTFELSPELTQTSAILVGAESFLHDLHDRTRKLTDDLVSMSAFLGTSELENCQESTTDSCCSTFSYLTGRQCRYHWYFSFSSVCPKNGFQLIMRKNLDVGRFIVPSHGTIYIRVYIYGHATPPSPQALQQTSRSVD